MAVLAVGSIWHDNTRGAVTLIYLLPDGSILKTVTIENGYVNGPELYIDMAFGNSLANIGDLDGPGGAATVLAVGAHYLLRPGSEGPNLGGEVFLLYLLPDGSLLRTESINAATPGMPVGFPERGDKFGSDIAWLSHAKRPDDLSAGVLAVGARNGLYGGRNASYDYNGDVYLLRVLPDGSLLSVDIINIHTPRIEGYTNIFGEGVSDLTPLIADNSASVAYALAVGAYLERGNDFYGVLLPIYLNEDLSVHSAAVIDGLFPQGFPRANLRENNYAGRVEYLGVLDPRLPNRHIVAANGWMNAEGAFGGLLFFHTLDR